MILLKTASRDRLKLFGQKQMPNPIVQSVKVPASGAMFAWL